MASADVGNPIDNYTLSSAAGNQSWQMFVGGLGYFRVRMHVPVIGSGSAIVNIVTSSVACEPAVAITGSVAVELQDGSGNAITSTVAGSPPVRALNVNVVDLGTGTLGVTQSTSPWVVSGTVAVSNFPATQAVTLASTTITGSVAVTGTFWQATQPVSDTNTATIATAITSALSPAEPRMRICGAGQAGSADTDVITIQGIAGGIVVPVSLTSTTITGTVTTSLASTTITGTVTVNNPTENTYLSSLASTVTSALSPAEPRLRITGAGQAGQADTDVITIQGIAGGIVVPVSLASTSTVGNAVPSSGSYISGIATTAYPTAATPGNLVGAMLDKAGRQAVVLNSVRNLTSSTGGIINSSTATSMIPAGGSNVFNDICELILTNSSSTACTVTITDNGATGSPPSSNLYTFYLAGNGGLTKTFATPLPQEIANQAWDIKVSPAQSVAYVVVYVANK
jgi:phage baseplate assembly protein W